MKLLHQFGVIMAVTLCGEVPHAVLPLPVPASIYGLLIMLFCLCTRVIKLSQVKVAVDFLIDIMPPCLSLQQSDLSLYGQICVRLLCQL